MRLVLKLSFLVRILAASFLLLFASVGGAEDSLSLRPFTTDGCSWSPDGTPGNPTQYQACCKMHDYEYWQGGSREQRMDADLKFRQCLIDAGATRLTAWTYFRVVRTAAGPSGCKFCWGYGWSPRPMGYDESEEFRAEQVPEMTKEEVLATPRTLRRARR